jgi:predicted DNA-binding transcriptional regulator YafY
MAVAEACRRRERLRFDYDGPGDGRGGRSADGPGDGRGGLPGAPRSGAPGDGCGGLPGAPPSGARRSVGSVRCVEPHALVSFDRRWYLVAWDTDRADWRTFRVDRIIPRVPTGPRFVPREVPDGDAATYLAHRLSSRTWPFRATVTLHEPAEAVADRVWPGMGVVEPVDDRSCLLHLGSDTPRDLAWMITSVDADFTLTQGPPELAEALRRLAARCAGAVRGV